MPEHPDLVLWSLWSRDRDDRLQGVYSHQTALGIHDLSDLMPSNLHMTVPLKFRKSSSIPRPLVLHYADLDPEMIEEREGFRVTRPMQAVLDLQNSKEIPEEVLSQAFSEARRSQDALDRARRINTKLADWQKTVSGESTKNPLRTLDLLAANPFITANGIVEKLNVAFTTAQRTIGRLEQLGILQQAGEAKRDRVYCARALLEILEKPAQLSGSL